MLRSKNQTLKTLLAFSWAWPLCTLGFDPTGSGDASRRSKGPLDSILGGSGQHVKVIIDTSSCWQFHQTPSHSTNLWIPLFLGLKQSYILSFIDGLTSRYPKHVERPSCQMKEQYVSNKVFLSVVYLKIEPLISNPKLIPYLYLELVN